MSYLETSTQLSDIHGGWLQGWMLETNILFFLFSRGKVSTWLQRLILKLYIASLLTDDLLSFTPWILCLGNQSHYDQVKHYFPLKTGTSVLFQLPSSQLSEILTNPLTPHSIWQKILMLFPLHCCFISFSFIICKYYCNSVSKRLRVSVGRTLGTITHSSNLHNFGFPWITKNILNV